MRLFVGCLVFFLASCTTKNDPHALVFFEIEELDDIAYPDNPDIGFRSDKYDFNAFKTGEIEPLDKGYNLLFRLTSGDSIRFENIDLQNFNPAIPKHLKKKRLFEHACVD